MLHGRFRIENVLVNAKHSESRSASEPPSHQHQDYLLDTSRRKTWPFQVHRPDRTMAEKRKPGGRGVDGEFFERTVNVARYRNTQNKVDAAKDRPFGSVAHHLVVPSKSSRATDCKPLSETGVYPCVDHTCLPNQRHERISARPLHKAPGIFLLQSKGRHGGRKKNGAVEMLEDLSAIPFRTVACFTQMQCKGTCGC